MTGSLNPLHYLLGSRRYGRRVLAPEIFDSSRISDALASVVKRWPELETQGAVDEAAPVFILAAGWGSGSTLVQRLVMSSHEVLVWGEPLDQAVPIQRLAMTLAALREGWPPDYHFNENRDLSELSTEWVANLVPPIATYRNAHRAFLNAWLGSANTGSIHTRWGLKEVRLTIDHARYLKWLYPDARFLFVYRDLYSSYISCKGVNWYSVWPDYKVSPPLAFAHHWRHLMEGFIEGHAEVSGLLVRYEDLVSDAFQITELSDYLGITAIEESLLEEKVGSRSSKKKSLSVYERLVLDSVAGGLRKQLGYG